jgi:hypothetical protein
MPVLLQRIHNAQRIERYARIVTRTWKWVVMAYFRPPAWAECGKLQETDWNSIVCEL